jgi:uncharacterized protein YbjQ (UPF0145 family)
MAAPVTAGGEMQIVTTETLAGHRIETTVGLVIGIAVRSRGLGGNIMMGLASLPAVDGDTMTEYLGLLMDGRDDAIAQMVARATARGANAIVGARFDATEVGHEMSEIVAYGTAVVLAPDR